MYTHVTVELRYGVTAEFSETMAKIVAIVTKECGWELRDALVQLDGRLHTVRHIWKMRDMNHYLEGASHLQAHLDFPALAERLNALIDAEHIAFAMPTAYAPGS
jgi:hypothetical protein